MKLADYFDDETMHEYASDADADSDPVSIEYLSQNPPDGRRHPTLEDPLDGAVVFIKGQENVLAFIAWARQAGLLHDHPWRAEHTD